MTHYLLSHDPERNTECVCVYTDNEMKDIFTAEQREQLAAGLTIDHLWNHNVKAKIIDMHVAARSNLRWAA